MVVDSAKAKGGDSPAGAQALIRAINAGDVAALNAAIASSPAARDAINVGTDELGFGATPLIAAARSGHRALVDALLAAGADIAAKSDWWAGGFSVLEVAPNDMATFLLERGAVLEPCSAARLGMIDQLAAMVAADPNAVHTRGGDGKTPLHWARDVATAALLVEHGADINARDVDHESTAIQYMVRDRQDVVRYLIERGATADIFAAAAVGDVPLATRLLRQDPSVTEWMIDGTSFPMQNPRAGGIIYIWTLGAGLTPHAVAQQFGHYDLFELLMSHSNDAVKLVQACLRGDEEAVESLLAEASTTSLLLLTSPMKRHLAGAAANGNAKAVTLMLRAGWPVDVPGVNQATPLHWAAWHGSVAMTRELLAHDPPLDINDGVHGAPPLHWALHGSIHSWRAKDGDYAGVVRMLLDAGARGDNLPNLIGSAAAVDAYRRAVSGTNAS